MYYAAAGVLRAVLGDAVWFFSRCPWMPELCHPLTYWQALPFLSFTPALFADMVREKIITGSSALAFPVRSWMLPDVTAGCLQERQVWASRFLLNASAPRQGRLLPGLLLFFQMETLTKYIGIFVTKCRTSLWTSSGMLTTELYWHSVETVGKGT